MKPTPSKWLQRRFELITQENAARSEEGTHHWSRSFRLVATLVVIGSLVWFLAARIGNYFNFQGSLEHPLIVDLTKLGVEWDVYYGKSPLCGAVECHLTADYPVSEFQKRMVLPAREFPLKDYKKGDVIYLRTALELPEVLRRLDEPISFQSIYVWAQRYVFYVNGTALEEGDAETINVTLPRDVVSRNGKVHIAMRIDPGQLPYQGLAHRGDIFIGPKRLLKKTIYDAYEMKSVYYLWFLLPKLTFSLVFALLFLALSRHRELFTFILYAFFSTADAFFHSGYPEVMLPFSANWELIALMTRCFSMLLFVRFIHDFYRRRMGRWLKVEPWAYVAVATFAALALFVLDKRVAFDSAVIVSALLRDAGMLFAIYTSVLMASYLRATGYSPFRLRVAVFLSIFFGVSAVPVFLDSAFKILEIFGLAPEWGPSLAWIYDLVFFMVLSAITAMEFGLTVSAKQISDARLEALEGRLELARAVQSLLLPQHMSGARGMQAYRFYHDPAEQMSGDWLNVWEDERSGELRLIFGDVVGKGPQAALAVSAIAGVLSDAKLRQLTMDECLRNVNEHLLRLFSGHIYSTVAALSLCPKASDGSTQVELYNGGAMGWMIATRANVAYQPLRSSPLGIAAQAQIATARVQLSPDTVILSFTDGCLESSREIKHLLDQFRALVKADCLQTSTVVQALVEQIAHAAKADDRTALIVSGDGRPPDEVQLRQRGAA